MWGGVFPRTYSYSGSVYVRKEVFLKETIEEMVHDRNRTSDNSADDRRNVWVLGEGEGRRRTRSRDDVNRMRCVHVRPCEFEMVRARRGQDVCKSRVVVNTANGTGDRDLWPPPQINAVSKGSSVVRRHIGNGDRPGRIGQVMHREICRWACVCKGCHVRSQSNSFSIYNQLSRIKYFGHENSLNPSYL